ncbi:MFS transporter [Cnuella takakiae]|nr:MFS transporter [Cnuella takakiae]
MLRYKKSVQGLKANWRQFYLLVLINAFVGSMIGLERAVLPGLAETLGINSYTALLSFIIAFGSVKALFNLVAGKLANRYNRRRVLLIGWAAALPVPYLLMYAQEWSWVIAANILLGINQGLAWSATVMMKIDLVGEKDRGFAMGLNEFAGYLTVGFAAFLATQIASAKGFSFYPFLPGILFSMGGLILTLLFVKDTERHVQVEAQQSKQSILKCIWKQTTFQHYNLGSVTISGFINNLNDGVIWGLLPVLLLNKQFNLSEIGLLAGVYPAVWGLGQMATGKMGDVFCKKQLITTGMLLQAIGLLLLTYASNFYMALAAMVLMGLGTALVYPNFLTVIAEHTHPQQRSESLSIFRFWRDSGYVAGALLSGFLADKFGLSVTFVFVAALTGAGGLLAHLRMCCTAKFLWKSTRCPELR